MPQGFTGSREFLRRLAAWTVVLAALQLMASAPVRACSCLRSASVLWPLDGTGVSADTTIVIEARPSSLSPTPVAATLRGPDGNEIALKEIRRIPRTYSCDGEIVFLRPEPGLRPGMDYEVTLNTEAKTPERVSFAAREKSQRQTAATTPEVTYLLVGEHPDCEAGECFDLAEVRVELQHALREPTWLLIRSGAERSSVNRWELSSNPSFRTPFNGGIGAIAEEPERLAQLSVPLPPQDSCVDVAIYGIDGQPVFEERRCEPDRCAVHKSRQSSTCGEPPRSGLDATRLSPASCDDPPVIEQGRNFAYPDFDDEQMRLRTRPAPGCHALTPAAANTMSWPALTIAFASMLLLRRRRQHS